MTTSSKEKTENGRSKPSLFPDTRWSLVIDAKHASEGDALCDGTVVAWGRDDSGQSTVPGGLTGVTAVAAGAYHSLALKDDGTVVAWGWNGGGQADVPVGLNGVTAIAAGYTISAAAKDDGTVVVWGDNSYGQLLVPDGLDFVQNIAAGAFHLLALQEDLIPAKVARLDQQNVFNQPIGIRRTPATNVLEVEGQVSKTTAGNWAANSDRRIKTDIQPVTGALQTIAELNPVTFRYTPEYLAEHRSIEDVPYYNVIAQEFREVFPDAVKWSGETLPDGGQILQVDTYPATITAIAAIKELSEQNAALEARLAALEKALGDK